VGLLTAELTLPEKKEFLTKIQSDLFILGGTLAGWSSDLSPLSTRVTEMEVEIDAMEAELPALQSFVLPGGDRVASRCHVTRSVCRRVERQVVGLLTMTNDQFPMTNEEKNIVIQYLNRLSDLFFILARFINQRAGIHDIPWIGIPRKK
jgi:cob(I)alamin adenosyltransferase